VSAYRFPAITTDPRTHLMEAVDAVALAEQLPGL
jgi:hypothetical protein